MTALNSLGFAKAPRDTRVVAAMSGGVDSSVVAALLKREGYDVVGVTLQLYDHGAAVKKKGACCAGADIHDAKRVAERLGVPHYVLDYEERFRKAVIEDFADAYVRGETPIPCARCNEKIKFGDLLTLADELGADALATGHYVRRIDGTHGPELHTARDATRDQSYFLFATTAAQLTKVRFPLGNMEKADVRTHARELSLIVADKPDSQDICFVPEGRYADVVQKVRHQSGVAGDIVDLDGRVVGMHSGVIHFTVGQRKGLGLSGNGEPLFVVRLDAKNARVVVGPREALRTHTARVTNVNWLAPVLETCAGPISCCVKVRSTRPPKPAQIRPVADGAVEVEILGGEEAVAPGQACVFYEEGGTRVLGGGWIARRDEARAA